MHSLEQAVLACDCHVSDGSASAETQNQSRLGWKKLEKNAGVFNT
jgi:hypothetical protein